MDKTEKNKKIIVVQVLLTAFVTTFMGSALNLSIPEIGKEFNVSAQAVGWTVTIYMLTCSALAVPFGRLADIVNRRKIFRMGVLVFSAGSALSAFCGSMRALLLFRVIQGVGGAMIFSTNLAIIISSFDEKDKGRALGYATSANYIGLSAGPVLGGILTYNLGWRTVFISGAVISGLAFLVGLICRNGKSTDADKDRNKTNFDIRGNVAYAASLVLIMYGLSSINRNPLSFTLVILGGVVFFAFIKIERKAVHPVVVLDIFKRDKSFGLFNLLALINYGSTFVITYMVSIYLQVVKKYTAQEAGFILIISTVVMAILSPIMGKLSDRHSPKRMSVLGMIISTAALVQLAFLPQDSSIIYIVIILVISGTGFSVFSTPNSNVVLSSVKSKDYGIGSSILATMRSIGHTLSMTLVTLIIGFFMGEASLTTARPELIMKTFHSSFLFFSVMSIIGILLVIKKRI